jgi:organic hydroperoxide reductase OsmC/OhrA
MKISARVDSQQGSHQVTLSTNANEHSLTIPPRSTGLGSSANGGELLFLALATCYCNDIYREAAKRGILVEQVQVEVTGEFGAEGEPAERINYRARIRAQASKEEIDSLAHHTDAVAEIQNTLRAGRPVLFQGVEVIPS